MLLNSFVETVMHFVFHLLLLLFCNIVFYCHIWSIYCVIAEKTISVKNLLTPNFWAAVCMCDYKCPIYSHDSHICIYTYIKHLWSSYYASALWGKRSHDRPWDMDSYVVKLYTANLPPIYMSLLYSTNINTEIRYWRLNPTRLTHMQCC